MPKIPTKEARKLNLTETQINFLRAIEHRELDRNTLNEMVPYTNYTALCRSLLKLGLITERKYEGDKRLHYRVTKDGLQVLRPEPMKVYIAGPMAGIKDFNFPAFDEAEKRWNGAGHTPISPATISRAVTGKKRIPESNVDSLHIKIAIEIGLICLECCEVIALLPGWEESGGATIELALAQYLGLKVFDAETMKPLIIKSKPWSKQ